MRLLFSGLLRGIVEAQKQLKNFFSCDESNYPETVQDSFDALVSALYNFSRNEEMRVEIGMNTFNLIFLSELLVN
jgi:succinate dehydrogenase flavin-adding protein (antitoxin of CptAB toxin-antitoxin module)